MEQNVHGAGIEQTDIKTRYREYRYVLAPITDVKVCSVCGENPVLPYQQVQYHKRENTGVWVFDFAIFGCKECLVSTMRKDMGGLNDE